MQIAGRGVNAPYFLWVIPSGATQRSRGISTEARKPRARCEHAKLFLAKMLLPAIGLQRFYLDPATASPCGLLVRQSLASQTSTPLRCAQDDTDGMKSRISGERSSPLRVCAPIVINHGFRREQAPALRVCANNVAIISLPQGGEGGPSKTVDEDVGSRFAEKQLAARSLKCLHCHMLHRGSRCFLKRPYGFVQALPPRILNTQAL